MECTQIIGILSTSVAADMIHISLGIDTHGLTSSMDSCWMHNTGSAWAAATIPQVPVDVSIHSTKLKNSQKDKNWIYKSIIYADEIVIIATRFLLLVGSLDNNSYTIN